MTLPMSKKEWLRQRELGAVVEMRSCACRKPVQVEVYPDHTFLAYHFEAETGGFRAMESCPVTGALLDTAWYEESDPFTGR